MLNMMDMMGMLLLLLHPSFLHVRHIISSLRNRRSLLLEGGTASEAAEELCELALKLGSSDNVTAVIVQFIH